MSGKETVLVTGASGFIALHCILQLLQSGYKVRGTIRSPSREAEVQSTMADHLDAGAGLSFSIADLNRDTGWDDAAAGCDYILHVASPYPDKPPKNETELIEPARGGALRVLRAGAKAGVKRVVLTSSIAAMIFGHSDRDKENFDEDDWTDVDVSGVSAYARSKTLAEKAAWDFVNGADAGEMELSVINPGLVFGPVLNAHVGTSAGLVKRILQRDLPACPNLCLPLVDVRDVASAHIKAMTISSAAGQRHCCVSDTIWMIEAAQILHRIYAEKGYKVPTGKLPDWVFRLVALFDSSLREAVPQLGKMIRINSEKARSQLDWQPHSSEDMIVALADSLIKQGVVQAR
jgi:dihydroflavonol-4-reductase